MYFNDLHVIVSKSRNLIVHDYFFQVYSVLYTGIQFHEEVVKYMFYCDYMTVVRAIPM